MPGWAKWPKRDVWQEQGSGIVDSLTWLVNEEFVTNNPAPISSPREAEPGPGDLYFVQTDGTQAIDGSKHTFTAQATPVWGDEGFYSTIQTRAAGLALMDIVNLSSWEECGLGWDATSGVKNPSTMDYAIKTNPPAGRLDKEDDTRLVTGLSVSTAYKMVLILRATGCFYLLDGRLLWVDDTGSAASLHPSFSNLDGVGSNDNFKISDLVVNGFFVWNTEFGPATDQLTTPSADETGVHEDNCLMYMRDITVPSAGNIRCDLRRSV